MRSPLVLLLAAALAAAAPVAPGQRRQAVLLRFDDEAARHSFSDESIARGLGLAVSDVDVWGAQPSGGAVVMLPERAVAQATRLPKASAPFVIDSILIPDVDAIAAEQRRAHQPHWNASAASAAGKMGSRRTGIESEFFDDYRDLASVHEYLRELALAHPLIARHLPIVGTSYEGFSIPAIEIGGQPGGPAVYIQATSHSREWISTSTAMALVIELLESEDEELRQIVGDLRFFILPVVSHSNAARRSSARCRAAQTWAALSSVFLEKPTQHADDCFGWYCVCRL